MSVLSVQGFPFGAPNFVCKTLRPLHPFQPQPPNTFPYTVTLSPRTALPGSLVTVTIAAIRPTDIVNGMLVTVLDEKTNIPVGGLINSTAENLKLIDCTSSKEKGTGLTHTERLNTRLKTFHWQVPARADLDSIYIIRMTVVQNVATYWVGHNTTFAVAPPQRIPSNPTTATLQNENKPTGNSGFSSANGLSSGSTNSGIPQTNLGSNTRQLTAINRTLSPENNLVNGGESSQRFLQTMPPPSSKGSASQTGELVGTSNPGMQQDTSSIPQQPFNSRFRDRGRINNNRGQGGTGVGLAQGPMIQAALQGRGDGLGSGDGQGEAQGAGMSAWLSGWFGR